MLLDLRQVKTLTKSFVECDEERFFAVFLRLAQREAELGNDKGAEKLRGIVQRARLELKSFAKVHDADGKRNRAGLHLLDVSYPEHRLTDVSLDESTRRAILHLLDQQRDLAHRRQSGLTVVSKCLLQVSASDDKLLVPMILAGELGVPLYRVHLERLLARKPEDRLPGLEQIFKVITVIRGIYLFDDLDLLAETSSLEEETHESSPWLETLLDMLSREYLGSLLLFVTSNARLIQHALGVRMDEVIITGPADIQQGLMTPSWELDPNAAQSDALMG